MSFRIASWGRAVAVSSAFLLTACAVGPDYERPAAPPDDAPWPLDLERGLEATPTEDLATWWRVFEDPVLERLVETAIVQNLDLRAAASRVREARFARGVVAGDYGPELGVSGSYERSKRSQESFLGFISGERDLWSAGFDATWELDLFGRIERGVEAADAEIGVAVEDHRDVLVSLVAEVARNYVELRSLQRRLGIARDNATAQRDTLELTRARFEAGLTAELDVAQARVNVANTESRIPPLRSAIVETESALAVLLGVEPGRLETAIDGLDGADATVPVAPPRVAIGMPAELLRRRPDVRRAERRLAASSARIGLAQSDLYPRLSLTGSVGFEADELDRWFTSKSERFSFGPGLDWNLFSWGRLDSVVHVAEERFLQAEDAYRQTVLKSLAETRSALAAFMREQDRRRTLREGVDAAESAVELAQSLYVQGISDFQNVLDAQRTLFDLQDQLAVSDRSVTTSLIGVYKSLGGGWPAAE